jgi:hypothetical protein
MPIMSAVTKMGAINIREVFYLTLSERMMEGLYDESEAMDITHLIRHDNAKMLYNGEA